MRTNGETYYLWVDKGRGAEITTWTFVCGDYAGLGHQIARLRDELEGKVVGKREGERPFDPRKVPIGFGTDEKLIRWFDVGEFETAELARKKKRAELKRRNGLPPVLPA